MPEFEPDFEVIRMDSEVGSYEEDFESESEFLETDQPTGGLGVRVAAEA